MQSVLCSTKLSFDMIEQTKWNQVRYHSGNLSLTVNISKCVHLSCDKFIHIVSIFDQFRGIRIQYENVKVPIGHWRRFCRTDRLPQNHSFNIVVAHSTYAYVYLFGVNNNAAIYKVELVSFCKYHHTYRNGRVDGQTDHIINININICFFNRPQKCAQPFALVNDWVFSVSLHVFVT